MKNYMCFVRHKLTRKVFLVTGENEAAAMQKLQAHLGGGEAGAFVSVGIYEYEAEQESVIEKAGA